MKLKASVLFCLLGFFNALNGQEKLRVSAQGLQAQVDPSFFIENKGQWPETVLYKTSMGGMEAWITKDGIVYDFYQFNEKNDLSAQPKHLEDENLPEVRQKMGQVVRVKLQNANIPKPIASRKQVSYFNYFINNDQSKWASNVGSFKEVRLEEVYDNIDLNYYFSQGYLRYDYIVKPGGSPNQIQFKIEGTDHYFINTEGELVFETRFGEVKQKQLELYQMINGKRVIVAGEFVKSKDGIQFSVADYDKTKDLIIDPLIYATFIGGSMLDSARDVIVDKDKNAYIVGYTYSLNFPVTAGAYDGSFGNTTDCILSKFDMTGSTLLYSTYIGGDSYNDFGDGICLDTANNIYILGSTSSSNFPVTAGAFLVNHAGFKDVVVLKLNSAGTTLEYSTYLGGASTDSPGDIAIDKDNNVYVVGITDSSNFPTSAGAADNSWNGNYDVFITKLNSLGSSLVYSTYWGGDYIDQGFGIAIDSENNAYVTGHTLSTDFPTTPNAFDQDYNGNKDAFFMKLNASGTSVEYSTYFGDTGTDYGVDIAVDFDNNAYIVGRTRSANFPVTPFAYDIGFNWNSTNPPFEIVTDSIAAGCIGCGLNIGDTIYINDVNFDAFVIKLSTLDSSLIYATFIGGSDDDEGVSIALDSMNNAYVTGVTESVDFPISTHPYDSTYNLASDVFVARLDSGGRYLDYSTFVGGEGHDVGRSIALDADADIYVTGLAGAELNFPTTEQAYDTSYNGGGYDIFLLKLGGIINSTFLAVDCISDISVDIPENQNTVQAFWELPFATTNCDTNATITISQIVGPPSGTFFEQGTHLIAYKIEADCGYIDTCSFNVNVRALGVVSLDCPEDIEVTTAPGVNNYLISWDVPSATTTCGSSNVPLVTQIEGISPNLNFPVGTHQVSYAAIDDCGYVDSCTFNVTVNPGVLIGELEINCLEDIVVVAPAGATTKKVSWFVSASSNCNVNSNVVITQIDGLSSNSDFPIGTNFVSFQITDNCNNIDTCSFNVIVNSTPIVGDMSFPCLEDITVAAVVGQNTHPVAWDLPIATTTCNVSSNIDLVQTFGLPPNSDFFIGTHEIVYLAQDDCNNSLACSFTIIVEGEIVSTFDPQNQWDVALDLYPNPSSDFLHLEMQTRKSQEVLIEIYALEGRLITSFKKELQMGNNGHIIPLLELANGLYILKVKGSSIYKTKKFVKQE